MVTGTTLGFFLYFHGYDIVTYRTQYLSSALILGTVAMATAPGAILAILHEYRARGPFTQRLLGVIAIDDALALVVYGLLLSRFGGKLFGTWLAARLTKSPAPVRKYLGLALLPQAGVSIGLILNAESFFAGEAKPTKTFHLRHF